MKILIVEDDAKVASFVARALTEEGYVTGRCAGGAEGLAQAQRGVHDLVVLDWMLPDLDGLSVCRELRRLGLVTPVLMLTARGELRERVLGLETGADDYLVKPFEIEELIARVRALLRRATTLSRSQFGDLELDRLHRRTRVHGAAVELTNREHALLLYLADRADQIVSKAELLAQVWQTSFDPGSNLVEVHMSRLRDKLSSCAWMIETVRGVGYRMRTQRST